MLRASLITLYVFPLSLLSSRNLVFSTLFPEAMSGLPSSSGCERSRSPVLCPGRKLCAMISNLELALAYAAGLIRVGQWTISLDETKFWCNNIRAAMAIESNNLVRMAKRRELAPRRMSMPYVREIIGDGIAAVSESDTASCSSTESVHRD